MGPLFAAGDSIVLEDRYWRGCAKVDEAFAERIAWLDLGPWTADLARASLLATPTRPEIVAIH